MEEQPPLWCVRARQRTDGIRTHVKLLPERRICLSRRRRFHDPSTKLFLTLKDILVTNAGVDLFIGFRTPSTVAKKTVVMHGSIGVNGVVPDVEIMDFPHQ